MYKCIDHEVFGQPFCITFVNAIFRSSIGEIIHTKCSEQYYLIKKAVKISQP